MTQARNIQNILYTTDLSDTALHVFSYAASLAFLYKASVTILHVIDNTSLNRIDKRLGVFGILTAEDIDSIKKRHLHDARDSLIGKSRENVVLHEALSMVVDKVRGDEAKQWFEIDWTVISFGNPVDKIIEVSRDRNCDLIIMGSHGYGLLEDLVGSTTRRVLRKSKVPVLVVPMGK